MERAVDTLLNGPIEARIPKDPPSIGWAERLRSWASTPFRGWLIGQPVSETSKFQPPSRLESERIARLGQEVYELYEDIARRHRAYTFADPNKFSLEIPLNPDEKPVDLEIFGPDRKLTKKQVEIRISKETLRAFEFTVIDLTPGGIQRIDRVTVFEESQGLVKSLNPYSPTQDLLALEIVGEFAKDRQGKQITGEETD